MCACVCVSVFAKGREDLHSSFAIVRNTEYRLFYRALLQKKPMILAIVSLLKHKV